MMGPCVESWCACAAREADSRGLRAEERAVTRSARRGGADLRGSPPPARAGRGAREAPRSPEARDDPRLRGGRGDRIVDRVWLRRVLRLPLGEGRAVHGRRARPGREQRRPARSLKTRARRSPVGARREACDRLRCTRSAIEPPRATLLRRFCRRGRTHRRRYVGRASRRCIGVWAVAHPLHARPRG